MKLCCGIIFLYQTCLLSPSSCTVKAPLLVLLVWKLCHLCTQQRSPLGICLKNLVETCKLLHIFCLKFNHLTELYIVSCKVWLIEWHLQGIFKRLCAWIWKNLKNECFNYGKISVLISLLPPFILNHFLHFIVLYFFLWILFYYMVDDRR